LNTVIWILIIITTAWGISFIGFYAGSCGSHPAAAWQGNIPFIKYCLDVTPKFEKAFAASDFILDTLVLIVPIPSVSTSVLPKAYGKTNLSVDLALTDD
jgi:hypothetical protein